MEEAFVKCAAKLLLSFILLCVGMATAGGQTKPMSERLASTAMNSLWKDAANSEAGKPAKWAYELGVVLKGLEGVWQSTGDGRYFSYIQQSLDHFVNPDGTIR